MKCPKCGYNSFEYNDTCTKCSNDLTSYKVNFGMTAIVLPKYARQSMAEELKTAAEIPANEPISTESGSDVFSFDLPGGNQNSTGLDTNPFDFNDEDFAVKSETAQSSEPFESPVKSLTDNHDFNSLLESTPLHSTAPAAPTEAKTQKEEFDLSDFSWDEPPAKTADGEPVKVTDDFSSLFGDSKGTSK